MRRLALPVALAGAALVLAAPATLAGSGAALRLGRVNKINAPTQLRGSTSKPLLQLQNKKGVPLALLARPGVAPLTVNSKTKVTNLNADRLDGLDGAALQMRVSGSCASGQAIRLINLDGSVSCQTVAGSAGGTVTSVASGTGLSGGPITTSGTLAVAPGYRLPQSCSANQVANADGSGSWNCATDQNSGGTVTSVDSGTGLTGGPFTTTGTLSIASGYRLPQGCSTTQVPKPDGSGSWSCASDQNSGGTVTSVGSGTGLTGGPITGSGSLSLASSYRLPQSCADNQVPKSNGSNTWSCAADAGFPRPIPAGNTLTALDSTNDVGFSTSLTIGADGLGLISYHDETNFDLKVAHCDNAACSSAATATLDSAGAVGAYTSVTIGADGLGLISYLDQTNGDLKVAHCTNAACSSAATATLDSAGAVGAYTSVTIGADGLGLISYYDGTNVNLKVAHCASAFCTPYFRRR